MQNIYNWFLKKASIRKKLVISYMILVLIPIIILGYYSFRISNGNLVEQTEKTMDNNLERVVSEMNSKIGRENDFMKYLAYNLEFRETLEDYAFNSSEIAQSLNKTVEPVFWYFITSDANIKEIHIITPYVNDNIGSFLVASHEYENEKWYQEHITYFNTKWSVEDEKIYATRTIMDTATTSKMIGILRTEFYLNHILEPFDALNYLDNGIIVKDEQGQLIYNRPIKNEDVQNEIEREISANPDIRECDTNTYLLKTAFIDNLNWNIYYSIDKEMILEQTYSILSSTLLIVAICSVLVVILVSIISMAISSRIMNLKIQAERIAEGDLDNPVFTTDTDEIGIVSNSLGKMTVRLNDMINRVYKIELEKKASELVALQAQINPHFLYNCLSSIKWKAIKNGEQDIANITGLVAKFYRTSLNNGQQITTVKNELENVQAYVEIEKQMHDGKFDVVYKLAQEGLECNMPNFLLQPVVENAIKHGIDYVKEEVRGKIIIEYIKQPGYLIFNIYNNGPLIESEEIEKLMQKQGKGYGIHNIVERIELYYDGSCGMSVRIIDDIFTCFTIKISDHINETT